MGVYKLRTRVWNLCIYTFAVIIMFFFFFFFVITNVVDTRKIHTVRTNSRFTWINYLPCLNLALPNYVSNYVCGYNLCVLWLPPYNIYIYIFQITIFPKIEILLYLTLSLILGAFIFFHLYFTTLLKRLKFKFLSQLKKYIYILRKVVSCEFFFFWIKIKFYKKNLNNKLINEKHVYIYIYII